MGINIGDLHRKYLKYLKRTAAVLGALLVFMSILNVLNYIYVDTDPWERALWHNFYEDSGKVDNLILGSSHVFCGVNPQLLDEINGEYNFNLASAAQKLHTSYYLLKEADKCNSLSHVYVELYYYCNVKDNFSPQPDYTDPIDMVDWRMLDGMRTSFNKFDYMLHIGGPERYAETCFPFVRYRTKLDDWDYIRQIMEKKQQEEYKAYEFHYTHPDGNGYDEYRKQGYYYTTREYLDEQRLYEQSRILYKNPIGGKSEKYLRKIIYYCRKRGIPITLFIAPIGELELISTENYDNYVNEVRKIADEYSIAFYDFNLAKEEYLPIQHGEYFLNVGHLNSAGADMFTPFFNEVVSRDESENEKYFYDSYAEKLQNAAPDIYGVYYRTSVDSDESAYNTYWVASNREEGMEYRIVLTPDEGEQYMVQDFAENKEFVISAGEHGICSIEARMKDAPDDVRSLQIKY